MASVRTCVTIELSSIKIKFEYFNGSFGPVKFSHEYEVLTDYKLDLSVIFIMFIWCIRTVE